MCYTIYAIIYESISQIALLLLAIRLYASLRLMEVESRFADDGFFYTPNHYLSR